MSRSLLWRSGRSGLLLLTGAFLFIGVALLVSVLGIQMDEGVGQIVQLSVISVGCAVSGWLWGSAIGRIAQASRPGRIALSGALANALITPVSIVVLGALEEELVGKGSSPIPIHNLYTLLFVTNSFLVFALLSGAVGMAERGVRLGVHLAWRCGFASSAVYLILNVLQDLLGRRVGGPNAAATATMITVTLVCQIGSLMAGSAVLGGWLSTLTRQDADY